MGEVRKRQRVFGRPLEFYFFALPFYDMLLTWVAGPLAELDDELCQALRRHRREHVLPQAARATGRRRLLDRLRGKDSGVSGATATLSSAGSGRTS